MKRALSLFLTLCLTAGLLAGCAKTEPSAPEAPSGTAAPADVPNGAAAPADVPSAAPTATPPAPSAPMTDAEELVSYEAVGVDIPAAAEQPDVMGGTLWQSYGVLNYSPAVCLMELLYFAMPKAEFEDVFRQYRDGTISQEAQSRMLSSYGAVGYIAACSDTVEDVGAVLGEGPCTTEELGTADGYTFWFVTYPEEDEAFLAGIDADFAEDFRKLQAMLPELLKKSRFYAPVDPTLSLAGQLVRFETTDLDGNPVTSEALFAQNEITMINCWATWCGPCKGELAELAELHSRMQAKGCGLIGIVLDGGEAAEEAKALLRKNGVTYPNIVQSDDMSPFMDGIDSIPTSLFVDKTGKILTGPIVGANVDAYEPTFESLLSTGADNGTKSALS